MCLDFTGNSTTPDNEYDYNISFSQPRYANITKGTTRYSFTVSIHDDTILEGNEYFFIVPIPPRLPDGYTNESYTDCYQINVTIIDDDGKRFVKLCSLIMFMQRNQLQFVPIS